jgi:hypothetical protein
LQVEIKMLLEASAAKAQLRLVLSHWHETMSEMLDATCLDTSKS